MTSLNEFQSTIDRLGSIVGREIIHNNGLSVIMCLASATEAGEEIDLAKMSDQTEISPTSLKRYIAMLKDAGVIEVSHGSSDDQSPPRICLAKNVRQQVSQLFNAP